MSNTQSITVTPLKPSKPSSPTGPKKARCRNQCGRPRAGHRKSECGEIVAFGSQENLDSPGTLTSSDDEPEPKRTSLSRGSYKAGKKRTRRTSLNLSTTATGDGSPVRRPLTISCISKQETVDEPETDYYSALSDSNDNDDVASDIAQLTVTSTNRNSLLDDDLDVKPNLNNPSDVKSSLEAQTQTDGLLAKSTLDNKERFRVPPPKVYIYASESDFGLDTDAGGR
ncbi:hypothetical protein EV360DRAFT_69727 [Lentinula raphanica]|nr:hypothetical protein EV360DRAFT_69727 [Lentinula raphanica]